MSNQASKPRARVHGEGGQGAPAQVPVPETPTQTILAEAIKTATTTDGLGRQIGVRRLSALQRMRLLQAAGKDLAGNEQWVGWAALAASCSSLDGEPVAFPATRLQIEALVERLDDEGLAAIALTYKNVFGIGADEDTGTDVEKAKN